MTAAGVAEAATAARPDRDAGFWTPRKVAWYRRALERSDYAARVLGAIEPLVRDATSALDVGAGCGALALPLAGRLERVTALEPAPAMAAALADAARERGLANVEVVQAAWGEARLGPHDLVLCAHVGALTRPGAAFLAEAAGFARHWVVLVRDAGGGDKLWFGELYPALLGRPYAPGCDHRDTLDALRALGVRPDVAEIAYRADQPFRDLEEACDFYQEYLGVDGRGARGYLRRFLEPRLRREADAWVAPYAKRAAVLWWRGTAR